MAYRVAADGKGGVSAVVWAADGVRVAELIGTEERSGGSGVMVQGWMAQVCVASGWDCGVSVV